MNWPMNWLGSAGAGSRSFGGHVPAETTRRNQERIRSNKENLPKIDLNRPTLPRHLLTRDPMPPEEREAYNQKMADYRRNAEAIEAARKGKNKSEATQPTTEEAKVEPPSNKAEPIVEGSTAASDLGPYRDPSDPIPPTSDEASALISETGIDSVESSEAVNEESIVSGTSPEITEPAVSAEAREESTASQSDMSSPVTFKPWEGSGSAPDFSGRQFHATTPVEPGMSPSGFVNKDPDWATSNGSSPSGPSTPTLADENKLKDLATRSFFATLRLLAVVPSILVGILLGANIAIFLQLHSWTNFWAGVISVSILVLVDRKERKPDAWKWVKTLLYVTVATLWVILIWSSPSSGMLVPWFNG